MKRRTPKGVPPAGRVMELLDLIAKFRLLPTPVAVGFSSLSHQTIHNALNWMASEKLIRRYTFGNGYSAQLRKTSAFYLSQKAVREYENVSWCPSRFTSKPTDSIALWAFHRAQLFLALHQDGYSVGRSSRHLLALRRYVVDHQREVVANKEGGAKGVAEKLLNELRSDEGFLPPSQLECRSCGARSAVSKFPSRPCQCPKAEARRRVVVDYRIRCRSCNVVTLGLEAPACCDSPRPQREETIPYDVAFHSAAPEGLPPVAIVLVDEPDTSLAKVLFALPLRNRGQPKIPVILRPADSVTFFDVSANRYRIKGKRFRLLTRAFSSEMDRNVSQFPYYTTSKVLTYRPTVGQRTA